MQIEKLRITEPIAKALLIALNDYCIHKIQLHHTTLKCLVNHDCLVVTCSFGCHRPGEIFELTVKGKRIANKINE